MPFRALGLLLLLVSTLTFAQGRKPAVEDFVGIEVDQPQVLPQGTESLYNLEQDINKIEANKKGASQAAPEATVASEPFAPSTIIGISIFLGLPLVIWFLIMGHLKKKASLESASNIEVLEKYRREREKKNEENIRKAS